MIENREIHETHESKIPFASFASLAVENPDPAQNFTLLEAAEFLRKTPNEVWGYAKRQLIDFWHVGPLTKGSVTFTRGGLVRFAEKYAVPALEFNHG